MKARRVIGIDVGGSKTCALVADGQGAVLGRGLGGPGNVHSVGRAAAQEAVEAAMQAALNNAGIAPGPVDALCIGAAGAGRAGEVEAWMRWCREAGLADQIRLVSDAELVIAAALMEQEGIVVIGGTGSIAFAQDAAGRRTRAGGWGYIIDDQGSAYHIACQALDAVLRAFDGRAMPTALTPAILGACACRQPPDLVGHVYGPGMSRHQLARLAVLVDQVAETGDAAAKAILERAGDALAELAVAAGRAAGLRGTVRCGLAGGVLLHSCGVRERAVAQIGAEGFCPAPLILVDEPAQGAVRLALSMLGLLAAADSYQH